MLNYDEDRIPKLSFITIDHHTMAVNSQRSESVHVCVVFIQHTTVVKIKKNGINISRIMIIKYTHIKTGNVCVVFVAFNTAHLERSEGSLAYPRKYCLFNLVHC